MRRSLLLSLMAVIALGNRLKAQPDFPSPDVPIKYSLPDQPVSDPPAEKAAADAITELIRKPKKADDLTDYQALAFSLARLGYPERAISTTSHMDRTYLPKFRIEKIKQDIWRISVRRRAFLGEIQQAQSLLPLITSPWARIDAFLALARAELRLKHMKRAGMWARQAQSLLKKAPKKEVVDGEEYYLDLSSKADAAIQQLLERSDGGEGGPKRQLLLKNLETFVPTSFQQAILVSNFLEVGESDLAFKIASRGGAASSVFNLIEVAQYFLHEGQTGKARTVLTLIEKRMPEAQRQLKNSDVNLPKALSLLASVYQRNGDSKKAQMWLEEAGEGVSAKARTALAIEVISSPLQDPKGLTNEKRNAIARKIDIHLKSRPALAYVFNPLQSLFESQNQAGEIDAAQKTILQIQSLFDEGMKAKNGSYGAYRPIIASDWRNVGNDIQAQKLIAEMDNLYDPNDPDLTIPPRTVRIEEYGFIDKALELYSKSKPKQSGFSGAASNWPYNVAYYAGKFRKGAAVPAWVKQTITIDGQVSSINSWVDGLTASIFENREETRVEFSALRK